MERRYLWEMVSDMSEFKIPFVCPHCDNSYWVRVRQNPDATGVFDCAECGIETSVRGAFEVVETNV